MASDGQGSGTDGARYDLVVIGGGPGGYVAAIRAAQLGLRAAVVERENLGGICLNWGCIPTKALLHVSELWRGIGHAADSGIVVGERSLDFERVIARSRAVADRLSQGVRGLMKKNRIDILEGEGRIAGVGRVTVSGRHGERTVETAHTIIATGARAREFPGAPADGDRIWNYRHALAPQALPRSLVIVGAGAIGMEFASFYATLGTRVTLVEGRERVLPAEDEEVSAFVGKAYAAQGIEIRTSALIEAIAPDADGVTVVVRTTAGLDELRADHVLVSIGIAGNVEGLGLERTAARVVGGHIATDRHGFTGEPGLYAIGDVAGAPWLAHKASHEGAACAEFIAGSAQTHFPAADTIPSCTYGHPQTASVGLTEQAARASGRQVRVGRFPFMANGKALAIGEAEGFVKTVFDQDTGEFLGAHLVGPQVTEMIHSFGLARIMEATEAELIQTVFPHPTLSEALHESVLSAFGRVLHL